MIFAEKYKIVLTSAIDLNAAATVDTDSIDMSRFHHCTYCIDVGSMTGADAAMTIASGATAGAYTSVLSFDYAYGQATAIYSAPGVGHDVLDAWTNAATLTITHSSYSNYMLICYLKASAMDTANEEEFLTPVFTDPGTAEGTVDCILLLEPRYPENRSGTALA